MTDRELLELAALAAGYKIIGWEMTCGVEVAILSDLSRWQPLLKNEATDCMGDALRLAAKIEMRITIIGDGMCEVSLPDTRDFKPVFEHDSGGDTGKATCRAITRLAAERGKAMK